MKYEILTEFVFHLEDAGKCDSSMYYYNQLLNQHRGEHCFIDTKPALICQEYTYLGHHVEVNADHLTIYDRRTGRKVFDDTPDLNIDLAFFADMMLEGRNQYPITESNHELR